MKKRYLLPILSLMFFSQNSFACTCWSEYSFCGDIDSTTSVLEVEIIERYAGADQEEYLDVKITETLQNEISEDTITVVGLHFSGCDEPIPMNAAVGDTLIINFPNLNFPFYNAHFPAFDLPSCHIRILNLKDGMVSGIIQPGVISSVDYAVFKSTLGDCNDFVNAIDDITLLKKNISISPNPFSEQLKINLGIINLSKTSMDVFSNTGQLIFSKNKFQNSVFDLPLSNFSKGIYFIHIINGNNFILKKVVRI